jgi:hypothetical protein
MWRPNDSVRITAPRELQQVSAPVAIKWRSINATSRYAVFVDRPPIKPGQSLKAIAGNDPGCQRDPSCPTAAYLLQHDVFLTSQDTVSVPYFAQLGGISGRDKPTTHYATIVLIDSTGHRAGESAGVVDFRLSDTPG